MASAIAHDVSKPEQSEHAVQHAVTTSGTLHYAINNAGIGGVGETDLAEWHRVVHDGRVLPH